VPFSLANPIDRWPFEEIEEKAVKKAQKDEQKKARDQEREEARERKRARLSDSADSLTMLPLATPSDTNVTNQYHNAAQAPTDNENAATAAPPSDDAPPSYVADLLEASAPSVRHVLMTSSAPGDAYSAPGPIMATSETVFCRDFLVLWKIWSVLYF